MPPLGKSGANWDGRSPWYGLPKGTLKKLFGSDGFKLNKAKLVELVFTLSFHSICVYSQQTCASVSV